MEWNDDIRTWVEALESDNYGQATKCMFDGGNNYCCLGVAARVNGVEFVHRPGGWLIDCRIPGAHGAVWSASNLPFDLKTKLGMSEYDVSMAVDMNDMSNFTFKQIARAVRYACDNHVTLRAGRDFVRDALRNT